MNHGIQEIEIVLGRPSNLVPWIRDHFFGQFWKIEFCLVSECEIFAHGGQIRILLDYEGVLVFPHNKCLNKLARPTGIPF